MSIDIKKQILDNARALGNSNQGLKEICSDLINEFGADAKSVRQIAAGTYLSDTTIKRMSQLTETEHGEPYRPNADTCERILKYFGASLRFEQVKIRSQYRNKPKKTEDE